jgi:3-deoxy-manno-octulosonate cytidylyltransferase (CMP-KDO synthetase)
MAIRTVRELVEIARTIRLLVLDVDGVLSPPSLWFTENGETLKPFDVRDGLGLRLLIDSGIDVAVITARTSTPLERRMKDLGIEHFYAKRSNKLATLRELAEKLKLSLAEICFVGDDLFDVPCLREVGLPVAVKDARECARALAHFVTPNPGGQGAVRDVADLLLDARFGLDTVHERFLSGEFRRAEVATHEPKAGAHPDYTVVIPARYASTRLPGKPLIPLAGKPMIVRVCENAARSLAARVCVATDDERIGDVVQAAGFTALMTSKDHASGTDRLAEVVGKLQLSPSHIVVNVQGDEPLLEPALIDQMAQALHQRPQAGIATLATPIHEATDLFDPNVVKVVLSAQGFALYFSRAPIPWVRGKFASNSPARELPEGVPFLRHVGLYAYRAGTIVEIAKTAPQAVESAESLEQLRAQWLGIPIHVTITETPPGHGVDTEEDVRRVEALLSDRITIPAAHSDESSHSLAPGQDRNA